MTPSTLTRALRLDSLLTTRSIVQSLLLVTAVVASLSAQAAVITAGFVAPANNLITNSSFDTGSSGWTLNESSTCVAGLAPYMWTSANSDSAHGNYIRLNECGTPTIDPTASQTVSGLTIGQTYTLSWDQMLWETSSGFGTGRSFGVFLGPDATGTLLFTNELNTLYQWRTFSVNFVAASTTATITFAAELDARSAAAGGPSSTTDIAYGIDNVTLVAAAVPEPASITLAALALGGVGLARRRRG